MKLSSAVRLSLWITMPFNFLAAYVFAFPNSVLGGWLQLPAQSHPFYTLFSGAIVGLFGLVYAWLALQPKIVRPLLLVGACGKLAAVLIASGLFLTGQLPALPAVLILGDLLFVVLWLVYLRRELGAVDIYP